MQRYTSFKHFYPFYLSQHLDATCRRLHYVGNLLVIFCLLMSIWQDARYAFLIPLLGYGCAWIGHFVFEKNRPATWQYPFYSLMGDWVMFAQMLTGRLRLPDPRQLN